MYITNNKQKSQTFYVTFFGACNARMFYQSILNSRTCRLQLRLKNIKRSNLFEIRKFQRKADSQKNRNRSKKHGSLVPFADFPICPLIRHLTIQLTYGPVTLYNSGRYYRGQAVHQSIFLNVLKTVKLTTSSSII